MTEPSTSLPVPPSGLEPMAAAGDTLSGMAVFGKTAGALLVVIAAVLLLAWLARRFNLHAGAAGQHLRVIGSVAIGQRERVVLVEVDKTWLVLGVGGGQITRLHELPAREAAALQTTTTPTTDNFAGRLTQVLARASKSRPASDTSPAGQSRHPDGSTP